MKKESTASLFDAIKALNIPEKKLLRRLEKADYLEDPILSAEDLLKLARQVGITAYDLQDALDREISKDIPPMPPNSSYSRSHKWVFRYKEPSEIEKRLKSMEIPIDYQLIQEDLGIIQEE